MDAKLGNIGAAIRRSQLAEARAVRVARELQEERARSGYAVTVRWDEPDLANATSHQRAAWYAVLKGRSLVWRGPMIGRTKTGLSLFDAMRLGRKLARSVGCYRVAVLVTEYGRTWVHVRY